eukprot:765407-Hanusia_phi.AAC.2
MPTEQRARPGYLRESRQMIPERGPNGIEMPSRWHGGPSQHVFEQRPAMSRSRNAGGYFRQELNEEPPETPLKEEVENNPESERDSGEASEDQGKEEFGSQGERAANPADDREDQEVDREEETPVQGADSEGEEDYSHGNGNKEVGDHDDEEVKDAWGVPVDENGDPSPLHYRWDIPSDHPIATESDRIDAIRRAEEKIEEGQKELRNEWKELMKHPPEVSESTRPDIMDPDDFPTATETFHNKHREMEEFRDALDAFVHDPQFNPFIVMKAHQIAKYGIPAPETDNIFVWRQWYREVLDKYQILKHEVEKIASGNWYSEESDYRRHELHRPGAYKHVWRNRDSWSPREGPPSTHSPVVETGATNFTEISGEVSYNASNVTREENSEPTAVQASPEVSDLEGRVDKMEKELKELVHLVKDSKESAAEEVETESKNISDVQTDSTNASKAEQREVGSPRLKVDARGQSVLYRSGTSSSVDGHHKDAASSTSEDKLFLHPPKEVVRWLAKAFENAAKERKGGKSKKSKLSSVSKRLQPDGDKDDEYSLPTSLLAPIFRDFHYFFKFPCGRR